jgi:hypothetical protein
LKFVFFSHRKTKTKHFLASRDFDFWREKCLFFSPKRIASPKPVLFLFFFYFYPTFIPTYTQPGLVVESLKKGTSYCLVMRWPFVWMLFSMVTLFSITLCSVKAVSPFKPVSSSFEKWIRSQPSTEKDEAEEFSIRRCPLEARTIKVEFMHVPFSGGRTMFHTFNSIFEEPRGGRSVVVVTLTEFSPFLHFAGKGYRSKDPHKCDPSDNSCFSDEYFWDENKLTCHLWVFLSREPVNRVTECIHASTFPLQNPCNNAFIKCTCLQSCVGWRPMKKFAKMETSLSETGEEEACFFCSGIDKRFIRSHGCSNVSETMCDSELMQMRFVSLAIV